MKIGRETFDKSERLCSRKTISTLFENGNIFYISLFKIVWIKSPETLKFPAQVAFSVSKRGFRLAVVRNLVKRRLREAYRRNKNVLYEHLRSENIQLAFVVIVRGNVVPEYLSVDKATKEMIDKLIVLTKQKPEDRSPKTEIHSQK